MCTRRQMQTQVAYQLSELCIWQGGIRNKKKSNKKNPLTETQTNRIMQNLELAKRMPANPANVVW